MFEIKQDNIKYDNKVYDIKDTLIGDCFIIYNTKKRKIKFIKSESNMTENIIALPQYKYIFESYFQNTFIIELSRGCMNRCAFCTASYTNLPFRHYMYDKIILGDFYAEKTKGKYNNILHSCNYCTYYSCFLRP